MVWENVYQPLLFPLAVLFFHLVNKEGLPGPDEPDCDPCARYQPLVHRACKVFRHHYTPHQEISVDESLVGTKTKTSLMQYLPNKHRHHWMLCNSVSNCCMWFVTQRGTRSQEDKDNVKKKWPGVHHHEKLLKISGYLNKGYHIFIDNYFMSVSLVCHFDQLSTYITGTVRRNRSSSRANLQSDKKCIAGLVPFSDKKSITDLVPFLHVFSARRNHKKFL
jgi:hypothetical protein